MASTSSPQTEEPFPYPLGVNVADSFTLRLCATNYFAWKQLMLRFLESHKLSGFVDGTINPPKKPPPLWESSLLLEERWEEEQETREKKRQEDWNQQHMHQEAETQSLVDWVQERELKQKRREGEWEESLEEQERWQEWLRRKEWGRECVRRRERMLERKEEERKEREEHRTYTGWKRSDDLVRGWILATVVEELLPQVMNLVTAREVWIKLGKILTPAFQPSHLKLYDIALKVLKGNRELASMEPSPLVVMAQKRTSFLSGTSLNLLERLIYYVIPLKLEDIANQPQRSNIDSIVESPQRSNIVEPPQRSYIESIVEPPQRNDIDSIVEPPQRSDIESIVEPVVSSSISVKGMQKLKGPFWAVVEKLVPPIKSVWETKVLHIQALNLVKWLCHYVEETDSPNVAEILTEPLRNATCVGIHEIVEEILESFPSAIHLKSEKDQSLFHLAIVYRRENVFNLIYQMEEDRCAFLSMPDASTNNALHLAGNLTPQQYLLLRASAAGAALQMQRELQWFEEVGKWMLPQAREHMNADGKTPQEVFTDTHKDLVKEGERWMRDTANSCTIVAALITTIVFAAAITVPGGSFSDSGSDKKGLPIRLGGRAFTVFGVSDALAMFSSSASLLMFLSILTCRYGEEDFRYSLPRRLIIGLVTLFLSIISMMVAFGATLKIVFGEKMAWLLYPVAALSSAPVALFALWQFPLLYTMIKSTYFPGIFGKKSNRILH
ncbi:uncharacterized protein LOC131326970 isoform X1 [Rhododendron vialii]|uniref:uncharacterized protein LOC131326970 isoform X1 n=1 Tax=Rhododendron vialii TaxID=182163 RepID=UPI00265F59FC|nr:uncharacterized protein LOC131326970 isoform X1 [Rhododendron vialii]